MNIRPKASRAIVSIRLPDASRALLILSARLTQRIAVAMTSLCIRESTLVFCAITAFLYSAKSASDAKRRGWTDDTATSLEVASIGVKVPWSIGAVIVVNEFLTTFNAASFTRSPAVPSLLKSLISTPEFIVTGARLTQYVPDWKTFPEDGSILTQSEVAEVTAGLPEMLISTLILPANFSPATEVRLIPATSFPETVNLRSPQTLLIVTISPSVKQQVMFADGSKPSFSGRWISGRSVDITFDAQTADSSYG